MQSLVFPFTQRDVDIQRLQLLLPEELRSRVMIVRSPDVNPSLITTQKVGKRQFAIQVDPVCWEQVPPNQQDLLFWHEVSRVQNRSITRDWELPVMSVGLLLSLTEVLSQNLILLTISLVMTGLAGNQLYQRHRGERSLRKAAAADQQAIELAVRSGYSFQSACDSLYDALHRLAKQTSQKSLWTKYQVRLRALEILVASKQESP